MADAPVRYRLLPEGAFGGPPRGVPEDAIRRVDYALTVLQRHLDLGHGVRVRWFAEAGPLDWDGDPGVFTARQALWGCVDPKAPAEARLNVALAAGPPAQLIRTAVHEALHCDELGRGLHRRLDHGALEALTQELTALLCAGVA